MKYRMLLLAAGFVVSCLARAQDVVPSNLPVLQPTTSIPGSSVTPGDFNGDGASDLLLFNPYSSQIAYWLLAPDPNGGVKRIGMRTINITQGYFVGAIGDFDGDGLADVVFTSAKRDLYLWTNTGTGGFRSTQMMSYPAGWQLIGAGDVNGDGHDDLLWMNPSACEFAYWLMDGPVRTGFGIIPVACGETPVGLGYFTPSNRISIVWANPAHQTSIWDSTGSAFDSYPLISYPSIEHVIAVGGGSAGQMLMLEFGGQDDPTDSNPPVGGFDQHGLMRTFDSQGTQTGFTDFGGNSGGLFFPLATTGFFIAHGGAYQTGIIYQFGNSLLRACSAEGRSEINYAPTTELRAISLPAGCSDLTLERGWFVLGALANGVQQEARQ